MKKPKNNSTIIQEQSITESEMKQMSTLISKGESYFRRDAKRRAQGVIARSEYEEKRKFDRDVRI